MQRLKKWIKKECKETLLLFRSIPSIIVTLFILSVVAMNLLANKSIDLKVSWLALDCGIIISWLSFLTMDMIVKRFGAKASIKVALFGVLVNLLISLIYILASNISGMWSESFNEYGEIINTALNNTIKGTWFVLLGSTIAFILSSTTNALLNVGIGKFFQKKQNSYMAYITRSYISSCVAQFVDNLTFSLIVSLNFFGWNLTQCFMCALTGALIELLFQAFFTKIGYKISSKWEEQEVGKEYIKLVESNNVKSIDNRN